MKFPEIRRDEVNSMKASEAFFIGLFRRIFNKRKKKVFIIGFHKTGTSSMGKALQILGYTVCGSIKEAKDYPKKDKPYEYIFNKAIPLLQKYDAFQDTPWFLFYRELYQMFPDDYFILTTRENDKWIKSVQKHFGNSKFMYHDLIYSTNESLNNETEYLKTYQNHNHECTLFFEGKSNFLKIDIQEFEWDKLTSFLNVNKPFVTFPHVNKSSDRRSYISKVRRFIKTIYYK